MPPSPPGCSPEAGDVTDNQRSRLQVVAGIVERERPTARGLLHRLAGARPESSYRRGCTITFTDAGSRRPAVSDASASASP